MLPKYSRNRNTAANSGVGAKINPAHRGADNKLPIAGIQLRDLTLVSLILGVDEDDSGGDDNDGEADSEDEEAVIL